MKRFFKAIQKQARVCHAFVEPSDWFNKLMQQVLTNHSEERLRDSQCVLCSVPSFVFTSLSQLVFVFAYSVSNLAGRRQ